MAMQMQNTNNRRPATAGADSAPAPLRVVRGAVAPLGIEGHGMRGGSGVDEAQYVAVGSRAGSMPLV